jgi:hypothetical protein
MGPSSERTSIARLIKYLAESMPIVRGSANGLMLACRLDKRGPMSRPDRSEAAPYYFTYIDKVAADDICSMLERQAPDTLRVLQGISDDQSLYRYAPGKWSIRDLVGHVNDT